MSVVYLYHYKLPVQLSQTDHGAPNLSRPMYNYQLKLYKSNHNRVDFVIRDNDKKPVKLLDCVVNVTISHVETQITYLQKQAQVTDEIKGRAQLYVSPTECANWPLGGYVFTVQLKKPGFQDEFLFVDVNNHVQGNFDLLQGFSQELIPSQEILASAFTPQIIDWDTQRQIWVTGALSAQNKVGQHSGFLTVAVYTQNWRGKFSVQSSLQNLSPTDDSWFNLLINGQSEQMFTPPMPGVVAVNFVTNAKWLRFIYEPHADNLGDFVKVLYKIN